MLWVLGYHVIISIEVPFVSCLMVRWVAAGLASTRIDQQYISIDRPIDKLIDVPGYEQPLSVTTHRWATLSVAGSVGNYIPAIVFINNIFNGPHLSGNMRLGYDIALSGPWTE